MKYFNSILFIVLFKTGWGQINLVPNPSFEQFSTCPTSASQITFATGWFQPNLCAGPNGSTDYFNSCASSIVSVPNNSFGFQYANSGIACAGLNFYNNFGDFNYEYLQIELTDSLKIGKEYCIDFFVSLANATTFAVDKIECHLSSTQTSYCDLSFATFNLISHISSSSIISDTANWVRISGTYIANGGEKFLTIGNFTGINGTDTLRITNSAFYGAYYYIDDVSVYLCEENDSIFISNVFTPNEDEINDLFLLENLPQGYEVIIYNRWGEIMQQFSHLGTETKNIWYWDGYTMAGLPCPEGVYYYVITLPDKEARTGILHLMR